MNQDFINKQISSNIFQKDINISFKYYDGKLLVSTQERAQQLCNRLVLSIDRNVNIVEFSLPFNLVEIYVGLIIKIEDLDGKTLLMEVKEVLYKEYAFKVTCVIL